MNIAEIGYNLAQLAKNVSDLQAQAASMPEVSAVREVVGGTSEPAEQDMTQKLRSVAGLLAAEIAKIRQFITTNADALTAAAEALQQTDADGSISATQATAFIDDVAGEGSDGPASGGSRSAGASGL